MPTIKIPKVEFTIEVQNLTGHPLFISVPYGGHVFRNFSIDKNSSTRVDRDLFLMGREYFQSLRQEGKIWYADHVQVPCDEQELGCDGGATGMGQQGETGIPGSKWYNGAGTPSGIGTNGDYYLDTSTDDIYQNVGGVWFLVGNIKGATGLAGLPGATGIPGGATGLPGNQGATGLAGSQWFEGPGAPAAGLGNNGDDYLDLNTSDVYKKNAGTWALVGNIKGVTGPAGPGGLTGAQGSTGPLGPIGMQGSTGPQGVQGPTGLLGDTGLVTQGQTGMQGLQGNIGATGLQGATGFGGNPLPNIGYGVMNRYQTETTIGAEVWVTSSSDLYLGLSWSRSGTTLTVNHTSHGHAVGDMVILRNTNTDYVSTPIIATTPNSFNLTVSNTGAVSGSDAHYSMGFVYAHNIGLTGGTLSAPSNAEVQLISMKVRTGQRAGTTYDLTVPASVTNGAGQNTGLSDVYIPIFSVRTDSDTLAAIAATIAVNQGAGYSTFTFGNLGSGTLSRFILLQF